MLIVCPHCVTSYQVQPTSLGETGRSVRCVRCHTVWFAAAPESLEHRPIPAEASTGAETAMPPREEEPPLETRLDDEAGSIEAEIAPGAEPVLRVPPPQPPLPEFSAGLTPAEAGNFNVPFTTPALPESDDVDGAPSIVPASGEDGMPDFAMAGRPSEDIETFAARRTKPGKKARAGWRPKRLPNFPKPGLSAATAALIAIVIVLVGWRHSIVRLAPQTASLYAFFKMPVNLRGITFKNVKTTHDTFEGVPVLVVEGTLTSAETKPVDVPRLRFSIRNASGGEIYSWTAMPSRARLNPGEELPFRSRLASPPSDSRDVLVRFFGRNDTLAGIK